MTVSKVQIEDGGVSVRHWTSTRKQTLIRGYFQDVSDDKPRAVFQITVDGGEAWVNLATTPSRHGVPHNPAADLHSSKQILLVSLKCHELIDKVKNGQVCVGYSEVW